jgi:hypothetical protein
MLVEKSLSHNYLNKSTEKSIETVLNLFTNREIKSSSLVELTDDLTTFLEKNNLNIFDAVKTMPAGTDIGMVVNNIAKGFIKAGNNETTHWESMLSCLTDLIPEEHRGAALTGFVKQVKKSYISDTSFLKQMLKAISAEHISHDIKFELFDQFVDALATTDVPDSEFWEETIDAATDASIRPEDQATLLTKIISTLTPDAFSPACSSKLLNKIQTLDVTESSKITPFTELVKNLYQHGDLAHEILENSIANLKDIFPACSTDALLGIIKTLNAEGRYDRPIWGAVCNFIAINVSDDDRAQLLGALVNNITRHNITRGLWPDLLTLASKLPDSESRDMLSLMANKLGHEKIDRAVYWNDLLNASENLNKSSQAQLISNIANDPTFDKQADKECWRNIKNRLTNLHLGRLDQKCPAFNSLTSKQASLLLAGFAKISPNSQAALQHWITSGKLDLGKISSENLASVVLEIAATWSDAGMADSPSWKELAGFLKHIPQTEQFSALPSFVAKLQKMGIKDAALWQSLREPLSIAIFKEKVPLSPALTKSEARKFCIFLCHFEQCKPEIQETAKIWAQGKFSLHQFASEKRPEILAQFQHALCSATITDTTLWNDLLSATATLDGKEQALSYECIAKWLLSLKIQISDLWQPIKEHKIASTLGETAKLCEVFDKVAPNCLYPLLNSCDTLSKSNQIILKNWLTTGKLDLSLASEENKVPSVFNKLAEKLISSNVTDISIWRDLLSQMGSLSQADQISCIDQIVKQLHGAGINNRALWSQLTNTLVPLIFSEQIELSREFRNLDGGIAVQMLLNCDKAPEKFEEHYLTSYKSLYNTLVKNAIQHGNLGLSDLDAIKSIHESVEICAPKVNWKLISETQTTSELLQTKFCGFPELEAAAGDFMNDTKTAIYETYDLIKKIENSQVRGATMRDFHKICSPLLSALKGPHQVMAGNIAGFENDIRLVLGEKGMPTKVDQALIDRLLSKSKSNTEKYEIKSNVYSAAQKFGKSIGDGTSLKTLISTQESMKIASTKFNQSTSRLNTLINHPTFTENYQDFYFYKIQPLKKNLVTSLTVGATVSCCLSPTGLHFDALLERLSNPAWLLIEAQDHENKTVAIMWAMLCESADGETCLTVDFTDAMPSLTAVTIDGDETIQNRLGNKVIDSMLKALLPMAEQLGATGGVLIGKQRYAGRMKEFPVFQSRTYERKPDLKPIGGFNIMGKNQYTDNVGLSKGEFSPMN